METFTTKDFATLLSEVLAEDREEGGAAPTRPVLPFDVLLDRQEARPAAGLNDPEVAAEYLFAAADGFSIEDEAVELSQPPSVAPFDVARELGLTGRESPDNLDRIRRDFAFANHPDRVAEDLRDYAIARMQIANRMIDDAKLRGARIASVR
jgi:hypothetical protein